MVWGGMAHDCASKELKPLTARSRPSEFPKHLQGSARIKLNRLPQVTVANTWKRKNPKVLGKLRLGQLTGSLVKVNEQRGRRVGSGKRLPMVARATFQGDGAKS